MGTKNQELVVKIAVCGKFRSGKDSVADRLKELEKFTSFAFSEGIWASGRLLFPQAFSRKEKPRALLQALGQKLREVDPEIWVNYTFNRMDEVGANRIVVTDLRQPNEFEALKNDGFFIIRVHADERTRIERAIEAGDDFKLEDLTHETEMHVDGFDVDFQIDNEGTLADLEKQVDEMYSKAVYKAKGLQYYKPKGDAGGDK